MEDGSSKSKQKSLLQNKYFIATIIGPCIISIALIGYIAATSDLYYLKGYSGINNVLIIFQAPIEILKLIIPLAGICAIYIKFSQTERAINISQAQIKETIKQNNFSNYFKHLETFTSHIENFTDKNDIPKKIPTQTLHRFIYPNFELRHSDESLNLLSKLTTLFSESTSPERKTEDDIINYYIESANAHSKKGLYYTHKINDDLFNLYRILYEGVRLYSHIDTNENNERLDSFKANPITEPPESYETYRLINRFTRSKDYSLITNDDLYYTFIFCYVLTENPENNQDIIENTDLVEILNNFREKFDESQLNSLDSKLKNDSHWVQCYPNMRKYLKPSH